MTPRPFFRPVLAASLLAIPFAFPLVAQDSSLAMLDRLQAGEWEIRQREEAPVRRICIRTGRDLIQLRHAGQSCNRYVVEDANDMITVQYTCRGDGYGRTSIRRESASLAQLESQGIAGGRPFSIVAEARRIGACR